MDGRFVLILRFLICFKVNSPDILSFPDFYVNGIVEIKLNIGLNWPVKILRTSGHKNIFNYALVDSSKLIFPPLYIKMGHMKQYVKALNKQSAYFQYIANKFPKLIGEKVKKGIFVDQQIRQLIKNKLFQST